LLLPTGSVWAQKRVALVIGNAAYQHEKPLANPVNDAQLMAQTLKQQGFSVELLTDLSRNAMHLATLRFARASAGADSAFVYFAGHGAQPRNGGINYLLPVDAKIDSDDALEAMALSAEQLVAQLERQPQPAKLRVVVLDACRDTRLASGTRGGERGLSRPPPHDQFTLVAFATREGTVALDGDGRHSPFAEALARHLAQAPTTSLRAIFERTERDVRLATRQKQAPRTYGDLPLNVLLNASALPEGRTSLPSAAEVELQDWETASRLNTVDSYAAYLAEHPTGRFSAAARAAQAAALRPVAKPVLPAGGATGIAAAAPSVAVAGPARPDAPPATPRLLGPGRVALVIGNSDYLGEPRLRSSKDAVLVANTLRSLSFDVELQLDQSRNQMLLALYRLRSRAKNADVALVYFVGLGIQINGKPYFMPSDTPPLLTSEADAPDHLLDVSSLLDQPSNPNSASITIMDANRTPLLGGTRQLARMTELGSAFFLYSTSAGGIAFDAPPGGVSPFAKAFAEHIASPGVTLEETFQRISDTVYRLTNAQQRPSFSREGPSHPLTLAK
jgi:uncharacterized caspase-like protein